MLDSRILPSPFRFVVIHFSISVTFFLFVNDGAHLGLYLDQKPGYREAWECGWDGSHGSFWSYCRCAESLGLLKRKTGYSGMLCRLIFFVFSDRTCFVCYQMRQFHVFDSIALLVWMTRRVFNNADDLCTYISQGLEALARVDPTAFVRVYLDIGSRNATVLEQVCICMMYTYSLSLFYRAAAMLCWSSLILSFSYFLLTTFPFCAMILRSCRLSQI
jgi:hypothetical protein